MAKSPEEIEATNTALVELVYDRLPQRFYGGERWWAVASAGLILRMAGTVENVTRLVRSPHPLDSLVLLRTLLEHAVTYCWISIDDQERWPAWLDNAAASRLKLHNDAKRFGIDDILTAEEAEASKEAKPMVDMAGRALDVDRYWGERIQGFRPDRPDNPDILAMRGLYTTVYRTASRAVHCEPHSTDPYTSGETPPYTVGKGEPNPFWCEVAGPLFGLALLVSEHQFRWPDADKVREVLDFAYPDAE